MVDGRVDDDDDDDDGPYGRCEIVFWSILFSTISGSIIAASS